MLGFYRLKHNKIYKVMKKTSILFTILMMQTLVVCCDDDKGFYSGIEHLGKKKVEIETLKMDSIVFDASMTSFSGQWLMSPVGHRIYFADRYAVGIHSYNLNGEYDTTYITQGRGPNEMLLPSWSSSFDQNGCFLSLDNNSSVNIFNADFSKKLFYEPASWFTAVDTNFLQADWGNLYRNPDPKVPQMYEFNNYVGQIVYRYGILYLPVLTEHVAYNPYEVHSKSKEFWRDSYLFAIYEPENISATFKLVGHYPSVYAKKNIPVFGRYSFLVKGNEIMVSFNADPKIYVMSLSGEPLYSFGVADDLISGVYPETVTFEDFEEHGTAYRNKHGYYDKLFSDGEFVFRTCMLDNGKRKLQIYKDCDLIGDILVDSGFELFGRGCDGFYYSYKRADYINEHFILVKFKLFENAGGEGGTTD